MNAHACLNIIYIKYTVGMYYSDTGQAIYSKNSVGLVGEKYGKISR